MDLGSYSESEQKLENGGAETGSGTGTGGGGGAAAAAAAAAAASAAGGGGAWSEMAVRTLLDSYTGKFMELQRSNLRQKDWQDVLATLASTCGDGYNYARCRNKLDSLKKKFKNVKSKKAAAANGGSSRSAIKWKWYDHMERLMERGPPSGQGIPGGIASGEKLGPSGDENTDEDGENHLDDNDENTSAAASLDDDDAGNELLLTGNNVPLSSLFDSRVNSGFLGAAAAATAAAAAAAGLGGSSSLRRQQQHQNGVPGSSSCRLPKVADKTIKKKSAASSSTATQFKEVAMMVIDSLERMEKRRMESEEKRMEMLREMEMRRNETNLQIAKLIVESRSSHYKFFQDEGNVRKDGFPQ